MPFQAPRKCIVDPRHVALAKNNQLSLFQWLERMRNQTRQPSSSIQKIKNFAASFLKMPDTVSPANKI